MLANRRCAALLLLLLAASTPLWAGIPADDDSQVDYGPLGKGQVQVSFLQTPTGAVVLEMSTDLEAVAGLVAATADRNLVAINGCQKTVNCCSILSCSSCTPCEILCGQSFLPIKPAD